MYKRQSLWDFLLEINQQGTTIILTTHYLEEAENLCRNIAIIDGGDIIENTSMNNLLKQIDDQVFIVETEKAVPKGFSLPGYPVHDISETKFSVTLKKDKNLNDLFKSQELEDLNVKNIRNQTNRLEELFVKITSKNE